MHGLEILRDGVRLTAAEATSGRTVNLLLLVSDELPARMSVVGSDAGSEALLEWLREDLAVGDELILRLVGSTTYDQPQRIPNEEIERAEIDAALAALDAGEVVARCSFCGVLDVPPHKLSFGRDGSSAGICLACARRIVDLG